MIKWNHQTRHPEWDCIYNYFFIMLFMCIYLPEIITKPLLMKQMNATNHMRRLIFVPLLHAVIYRACGLQQSPAQLTRVAPRLKSANEQPSLPAVITKWTIDSKCQLAAYSPQLQPPLAHLTPYLFSSSPSRVGIEEHCWELQNVMYLTPNSLIQATSNQ